MRVLRKMCAWWREFWGEDTYWLQGADPHQWDNKVEILRPLDRGRSY